MAYIGYEFYYDGTRATLWGYIQTAMINFGWELHDNISANVKVYKSNGESGSEPYGYVWIDAGTSTYIQFAFYQHWNATTHAGVRVRYPNNNAIYGQIAASYMSSTSPILMCGDKNIVFIGHPFNSGYAQSCQCFGHIPVRFDNYLTGAVGTAGTAGTITIASSSGQGAGKRIQIAGAEGCDSLIISSTPNSTTRILDKLPRDYSSGAVIGAPASVFGCFYIPQSYSYFYPVSLWGDSGTTVSTSTLNAGGMTTPAISGTLFYNEGKYYLSPIFISNISATTPGQFVGTLGDNFLYCAAFVTNIFMDAALINNDSSFSRPYFATMVEASIITDSTQSWAVNEHAGKLCCIAIGWGAGALKRILSNTSDTLTLDSNWVESYYPGIGSEFKICDVAFRALPGFAGNSGMVKVTRTDAPT